MGGIPVPGVPVPGVTLVVGVTALPLTGVVAPLTTGLTSVAVGDGSGAAAVGVNTTSAARVGVVANVIVTARVGVATGTRAAFMLDEKLNILGKIPASELVSTIRSLNSGIYAIVLDDVIDKDLLTAAERANVSFLVAMDSRVQSQRLTVLTTDDL